jgi:hypothetical protein
MARDGASTLKRIAHAAAAVKRANNRPRRDIGPLLQLAALLWLTNPGWDEATAAKQAAKQIVTDNDWRGVLPLSKRQLEDRLRDELQDLPEDILSAAEQEARSTGKRTRFDPPAQEPTIGDLLKSGALDTVLPKSAVAVFGSLAQPARQLKEVGQKLQSIAKRIPTVTKADVDRWERVLHLVHALHPELDDMPITEIAVLLEDIRDKVHHQK